MIEVRNEGIQMIHFTVVSKGDAISESVSKQIISKLIEGNAIEDKESPEIVITVGGDGTMLRAIHQYLDTLDSINFVGIHAGTLGFFTNYTIEQIDKLCDDILSKTPEIRKHNLLEISFSNEKFYAVNELRIENSYHTQTIDMYINNEYLQTFKGNGVCLSTSVGSTGYNRSLNGPIIDSSLNLMVLSEIAGIHHRKYKSLQSPLVMGADTEFKMVLSKSDKIVLGIDHLIITPEKNADICCKLSNKAVKMAFFEPFSYTKRLHRAFIE